MVEIEITGWQKSLEAAIGKLTVFQKTEMPYILERTLNNRVRPILLENERQYIQETFDQKVPFTLNSVLASRATKRDTSILVKHFDAPSATNKPARYLQPQVTGGPVYVTRFSWGLRQAGVIADNEYVLHWDRSRRRTGAAIRTIQRSLINGQGNFFVAGSANDPYPNKTAHLAPGIYEQERVSAARSRQGIQGSISLVFRLLDAPPSVPAKYQWTAERLAPVVNGLFREGVIAEAREVLNRP